MHFVLLRINSPLTPELIITEGNFPHFGEISFGFKGQILFGLASVHAKIKFVIFRVFPQVKEISAKSKFVICLSGTGPLHPEIGVVFTNFPSSPLYSSRFPQKAKDVLVEPVELFIDNVNVFVTNVPESHELHKSPPVSAAPTNDRSPDVHEVYGLGTKDCANVTEKLNKNNKRSVVLIFIESNFILLFMLRNSKKSCNFFFKRKIFKKYIGKI